MCLLKNNWKMDNKFENIDSYYKNNLGNHTEDTDSDIWKNMWWTLFWMRYRWLAGLGIIIMLLGTGSLIYLGSDNLETNNNPSLIITNEQNNTNTNNALVAEADIVIDNEEYPVKYENEKIDNNEINTNVETASDINEPVRPSGNMHTINSGKTNINYKEETEVLTEAASFGNANNKKDKPEISVLESKDVQLSLSMNTDTIFGQNILIQENKKGYKSDRFSLVIYAGPAYSLTNVLGDNSEYVNYRNANESNHESWSVGAEIKFHLKNWIITSGLSYSVYNQNRSYTHTFPEYSPEDSFYDYDTTWAWFFDPPVIGKPIVAGIDSSWVKVYDEKIIDNSGINRASYLEIPLLIGYRYNANLFSFEVNTGAYVGFLMNSNIRVPDINNNNNIVDAQETNKTMVNFAINASVYYHLNRSTSIFVSPYYKQNLKSVFNDNYPVNQRFKTYGINLGISFSF